MLKMHKVMLVLGVVIQCLGRKHTTSGKLAANDDIHNSDDVEASPLQEHIISGKVAPNAITDDSEDEAGSPIRKHMISRRVDPDGDIGYYDVEQAVGEPGSFNRKQMLGKVTTPGNIINYGAKAASHSHKRMISRKLGANGAASPIRKRSRPGGVAADSGVNVLDGVVASTHKTSSVLRKRKNAKQIESNAEDDIKLSVDEGGENRNKHIWGLQTKTAEMMRNMRQFVVNVVESKDSQRASDVLGSSRTQAPDTTDAANMAVASAESNEKAAKHMAAELKANVVAAPGSCGSDDDCSPWLFCASSGLCLDRYAVVQYGTCENVGFATITEQSVCYAAAERLSMSGEHWKTSRNTMWYDRSTYGRRGQCICKLPRVKSDDPWTYLKVCAQASFPVSIDILDYNGTYGAGVDIPYSESTSTCSGCSTCAGKSHVSAGAKYSIFISDPGFTTSAFNGEVGLHV